MAMLYLFISTVCFLLPFFFPAISPLLFVSLVPLVIQSYQSDLTFQKGFLWGIIAFSCHLFWFFCLIFFRGTGYLRITAWVLTISWFCAWTGIWFWLVSYIYKRLQQIKVNPIVSFIIAWLIPTILYFYFIIRVSFFLYGVVEGYIFFNPFISLAYYPQLIWCVSFLGLWGALICLILFQIFLVLGFVEKRKKYFLMAVIALLPFLAGSVFYKPIQINTSGFYFVQPWWYQDKRAKDPMFVGYRMVHDVTHMVYDHQDTQVVVMPESTFGWNLYEYEQFVPLLCDCASDIAIIFGGQRKVDNTLRNSCFIVRNGKIVWVYDKIHLIPFVERIPQFLDCEMFTSKNDVFHYGDSFQDDTVQLHGQIFQVFLCSELFCETKYIKGLPILFLYNDDWLHCLYMKKLAVLFLHYISIQHNVPILFCSTSYNSERHCIIQ